MGLAATELFDVGRLRQAIPRTRDATIVTFLNNLIGTPNYPNRSFICYGEIFLETLRSKTALASSSWAGSSG
jgi:hypothetical protein